MARGCISRRRTKTKGVVYEIKYRAGDGTQVKKAIGSTRSEAQRALNAALAAVERGEQRTTSRETFAEAADRGSRARSRGSRSRPTAATRSSCACG